MNEREQQVVRKQSMTQPSRRTDELVLWNELDTGFVNNMEEVMSLYQQHIKTGTD